MVTQSTKKSLLTLQPLMQIELFIAALLPATGILLVTAIGTMWIMPQFLVPFLALSLVCAMAIFLAEFAFIFLMQGVIKGQFSDLIVVCQTYLAGNRQVRAIAQGEAEFTTELARILNALFDTLAVQWNNAVSQKTVYEVPGELLKKRVKQFVVTIAPFMNDNLRMQTERAVDDPGMILDICSYMAQECIQYIKLTRSVAKRIVATTSEAVKSSIDLAQNSENLMLDFSQTTEKVEKLVAVMQRQGGMLQLYVDNVQEASQMLFLPSNSSSSGEELTLQTSGKHEALSQDYLLHQYSTPMSQSIQSLKEAVNALQEQTLAAESVIEEFYNFAQGMYHANTGMLRVVEQISLLVKLAEQWSDSPTVFQLPDDDAQHPFSMYS